MGTPFITGQTLGSIRNNFSGSVGFSFVVGAANIVVEALGRWVVSGNNLTHVLTIYDYTASSTIGTVTVNCSGATAGQYLYGSITPVTLIAGQKYAIESVESSGGDQWYDHDTVVTHTTAGTIPSSTVAHAENGATNQPYVPPNFLITPPGVNESIALGVTAHAGPAGSAGRQGAVSLGVGAHLAPAGRVALAAGASFGVDSGISDSGGKVGAEAIALGVDLAIEPAPRLAAVDAITLRGHLHLGVLDQETFGTLRRGKSAVEISPASSGKATVR